MKHVYLFALVCLALLGTPAPARAQSLNADTRPELNYLFAPLDKTQVPTGFLVDYGLPLLPLDVFNGILTDSSRTTPAGFRFLYATAYSARITGPNPLPTIQTLNARAEAATAAAGPAIPLLVQRISYAAVRPEAFSLDLLRYQNGQLYDVPGRAQSPYQVRTLFAAAPTRSTAPTGDVSFVFRPDLHFQSGGGMVQALRIDFGDGRGYLPAAWDQPIAASYTTAGSKRIKVRVTYSNLILATPTPGTTRQAAPLPSGTSYDSHFDVDVLQPATACADCRYADPGPNITIAPVAGVHSGAIMSIRYGGNHTQLVRPFIVVEGFDRSRVAPATASNYDVNDFLREIIIQAPFDFRDALDNIGEYDLVFVDFNYGTDDILRNARAFEEVLDRVEQLKVVNPATGRREDNVVMGMSMGGLISRYKLAEMTKAGRPTHTRLLVLQDSPQRGANIPLGIQAAVRQADFSFDGFTLADVLPALRQVLQLLDEPATRQLLVHRATTATGGFQANTFLDGTYQPMIRFAASAPQPGYRVVAVSQGSQCGRDLFAPYTELVRADGRVFASPMPWIRRTSYETSVVINALPSGGQARRVSYMALKKRVRLFGFINVTTTSSAAYTCPGGLLAWDGVPGGTVPVSDVPGGLNQSFRESFLPFFDATLNAAAVEQFSFLPTASSLDVETISQASLLGSYVSGSASVSRSFTDGFIAQEQFQNNSRPYFNQPHLTFTARNGQWIFNEMQGLSNTLLTCSSECSPYPALSIAGPGAVCSGRTADFTVAPPFGAVTGWTVTPANLVTVTGGGSGSTTLTLAPASTGSSGVVTLTAQLSNGCFVATTQPLRVAIGQGQLSLAAPANVPSGAPFVVQVASVGVAPASYTWFRNGVAQPALTGAASATFKPLPNRLEEEFEVRAIDECQQPVSHYALVTVGSTPAAFAVYPNPTTTAASLGIEAAGPFEAALYDRYSQLRQQGSTAGRHVQLATQGLLPGIYYLRVCWPDGRTQRRQVVLN